MRLVIWFAAYRLETEERKEKHVFLPLVFLLKKEILWLEKNKLLIYTRN